MIDGRAITRAQVEALHWWHSIKFDGGLVTPGKKTPKMLAREAELVFRYPVKGKSVLDIGASDGYFSFEAKRRGASRVLAMDWDGWRGRGYASFNFAREAVGFVIEDKIFNVHDLTPETAGQFDVVLFLGVLYHLKDPLDALERIASVVTERLVLETHLDARNDRRPVMRFYPGATLNGDPSNWWGPNVACVRAMLTEFGFKNIAFKQHPLQKQRGFFQAFR
ncbi:MAG: DUF1698 domain-containing protein [Candidatus Velthaea sp.]